MEMTNSGAAIYRLAARARNEIYGCKREMNEIMEQAPTADLARKATLTAAARQLEHRAVVWLALLKTLNRTIEDNHERS